MGKTGCWLLGMLWPVVASAAPVEDPTPDPALAGLEAALREWEAEAHSVHRHDGFYFSMGGHLGGAAVWRNGDVHLDATWSPFGLAIGGALADGVSVLFQQVPFSGPGGTWHLLGVATHYYPDPTGGLHVGIGIGLTRPTGAGLLSRSGDGLTAMGMRFGHGVWIGEQWSFQVAGRLVVVPNLSAGTLVAVAPSLVLEFVYQ